ncbi:AAA domain-containig protein [Variovorax paradoxus B4]|uniref:AAA domain-containig protein n=1 Tax=Variovorax paradoxus B4 TaxID=1246301 RepID=T1XI25_VARPD|nr:ATP-binding protein [Variovorax paradoxus]AGU51795.1 AAA domain-containig protein [Variovorax paradoxus B4]
MDEVRLAALTKICSLLASSTQEALAKLSATLHLVAEAKKSAKLSKPKTSDWNKIKEIAIGNFKTIRQTTVPLGDVTILVGPNGSGKSSVLQAIHWAARAASYITPKNTKEVISFDRLDYLPSSKPLSTAYFAELGSGNNQTHTSVAFVHDTAPGVQPLVATVKIWAARNKGAISAHIDGGVAVTPFKQRQRPITAYIPGLAGLAERETILAQPLMRRHAASGDAGGVLRNVLYNLALRQGAESEDAAVARLARLNELLSLIHPYFRIIVSFDEREDIHINASYVEEGIGVPPQPLESLATGILQVLQIFAYLILFRPRLLLVDEPDAHLHPDKQERLIEALEAASQEFGTQIILTTHSQHIVRAASAATQLVWMRWGEVVSEDEKSIRALMGWGALDKSVILFIEDEDDQAVRSILRQWPHLTRQISVCKCFGVDNLPRQPLLEGLMNEGEIRLNIVLHRDCDFMSEEESDLWAKNYPNKNTFTWVTKHVDVEAYYCQPEYISALYGVDLATASAWIQEAAVNVSGSKQLFKNKRELIRRLLYPDGGSPNSETLWTGLGGQTPSTVLGKNLHKALKTIVKKSGFDEHSLSNFRIPKGFEMAPDLRLVLERALD